MTIDTETKGAEFSSPWVPTRREKLPENIVKQILDAIKNGEIMPGERMQGEIELAASFGVSRNSMREALNVLNWFGILEKRQGQGTYISEQAPQKINNLELIRLLSEDSSLVDLSEMRMTLDSQIAFWVAERATQEDLEELEEILRAEELAIRENGFENGSVEEPSAFHQALARMCGNKLALKFFESIVREIIDSRKMYYLNVRDKEQVKKKREWNLSEHRAIFRKIKERDALGAQEAMYRHLYTMLMQMIEEKK